MAIKQTDSASSPQNPTNLPPRYEIRRLTHEHSQWAAAIVIHSNIFHSTVFSVCYPDAKGSRFNKAMGAANYVITHQIDSNMSFGVFDAEYTYKRPESAAIGGKFYWDPKNDDVDEATVLEQMDFPLVSVALAYDGISPLEEQQVMTLVEILPLYGLLHHILKEKDPRDPVSWTPTGPRQVLMRNATSTRRDYEGQKLMGQLARFMMREAKISGYRGIQIETLNDRVEHVWANPPAPFIGKVVSSEDSSTFEQEDEASGDKVKPFAPSTQRMAKIYVSL